MTVAWDMCFGNRCIIITWMRTRIVRSNCKNAILDKQWRFSQLIESLGQLKNFLQEKRYEYNSALFDPRILFEAGYSMLAVKTQYFTSETRLDYRQSLSQFPYSIKCRVSILLLHVDRTQVKITLHIKKLVPESVIGTHLFSWVKRGFKTNTECFSFNSEYIQEESVEAREFMQRNYSYNVA